MLKLIIAFVAGSITGFMTAALFSASKEIEPEPYKKEPVYRCKTNAFQACGDQCCHLCLGANDCIYACELHPAECGQSKEDKEEE